MGEWRHASNTNPAMAGYPSLATLPFLISDPTAFDPGPPYGVDPNLWARLGVEAGALADHLTDGDEDAAMERAGSLRSLLRPFV